MICEDDIIFKEEYEERETLNIIAKLSELDLDYIDLAGGCNLMPVSNKFATIIQACACTKRSPLVQHAYMIKRTLAKKLLEAKIDIMFPIDYQLIYQLNLLEANVGWLETTLSFTVVSKATIVEVILGDLIIMFERQWFSAESQIGLLQESIYIDNLSRHLKHYDALEFIEELKNKGINKEYLSRRSLQINNLLTLIASGTKTGMYIFRIFGQHLITETI